MMHYKLGIAKVRPSTLFSARPLNLSCHLENNGAAFLTNGLKRNVKMGTERKKSV